MPLRAATFLEEIDLDVINRINSTRFLGKEFLCWLWYRSATGNGLFELDGKTIEVWFDSRIVLEGLGDIKETDTIKAETPTETTEARAALLTGKTVSEAKLRVVFGQKQWSTSLKGESLQLSGVKTPALLSREDDDQLFERFQLFEEIGDIIDELYEQFIAIRLNESDWDGEVNRIRSWVRRVDA